MVLGAETLLGKEVAERCAPLAADIALRTCEREAIGRLTESAGGAVLIGAAEPSELATFDLVIDCAERFADAGSLRDAAPPEQRWLAANLDVPASALPLPPGLPPGPALCARVRCAHPAALLCTDLLGPLAALGLIGAVASILQPVSLFGQQAIEEVFGEMRELLAFKPVRAQRFGQQLAFNVLPVEPAEEAALAADASRLAGFPVSVQRLQVGVFHALVGSFHLTFAQAASPRAVRQALASSAGVVLAEDPKRLSPLEVAGAEAIAVGAIEPDGSNDRACWVTAMMDNLSHTGAAVARLAADLLELPSAGGR